MCIKIQLLYTDLNLAFKLLSKFYFIICELLSFIKMTSILKKSEILLIEFPNI